MTCAYCDYAAKFHSYQRRRVLTVHGALSVARAYYYCGRCKQSFIPYDDVLGLVDEISPGLMPLVCLAGTLLPFADAAQDVLKRFSGVRVSASTVLRCSAVGEHDRGVRRRREGRGEQRPAERRATGGGPDHERHRREGDDVADGLDLGQVAEIVGGDALGSWRWHASFDDRKSLRAFYATYRHGWTCLDASTRPWK